MAKFYITTPIYYVNDTPHIGNAYTTVVADVLARWHRLVGDRTFFLTGTDEHGAKIETKANEVGKGPQELVDEIASQFQTAWQNLNISQDRFIRTTESAHIKAVQNALQYMYDQGDIYLGKYEGLYCQGCEQYKSERDLVDGKCADHGTVPEKMSQECYMFRLSKYQAELLGKIKSDEFKILPVERKNELISFYEKEGLNDIAFSRKNVKWGIELPWDPSQTAYVWADAFLNYLTGLGWTGHGDDAPEMWPPDIQLMSKDIMRVHATIWPAMLLSLDLSLPLPKQLFIHGYFLIDGKKMSKSLGNVIRPEEMVARYGVDATRYLLLSAAPFGNDGDVSWAKFDEKYNADLANGLGNLVARTLSMTEKYFDGRVPNNLRPEMVPMKKGKFKISKFGESDIGEELPVSMFINSQARYYVQPMEQPDLFRALFETQICISGLDKYISDYQPFKLIKEDKEKTAIILYNCLEGLRFIALMLLSFMPTTAEKIWESLGLNPAAELKKDFNEAIKWGGLPVDAKVKKVESLFPRI